MHTYCLHDRTFLLCVVTRLAQVLRTPRNIFIANLALTDILLCSFTIPLTLVDVLTAYWELGPEMVKL